MLDANVLDQIQAIRLASSPAEVLASLRSACAELELSALCLSFLPGRGKSHDDLVLAHDVPGDWLELYLRENYAAVDPGLRHCRRQIEPFYHQDSPYDQATEPRAGEVLRRAKEFDLSDAVFIPVQSKLGPRGLVWINGAAMKGLPVWGPIAHTIAMCAFHRLEVLLNVGAHSPLRLSAREREVLHWIAAGKSSWEIGEILSISRRTVDWHVKQVLDKLGVQSRIQAAVIAALEGEIEP